VEGGVALDGEHRVGADAAVSAQRPRSLRTRPPIIRLSDAPRPDSVPDTAAAGSLFSGRFT